MSVEKIYSVLIVEDEYPARMLMIDFIMNCPELKLAGIAEDGKKALNLLAEKDFDLVFIDINLPVMSGMEVMKKTENRNTFFILTTAYSEYAVQAFELDALDYLLKPFSFHRFRKSVEKALKFWKEVEIQPEKSEGNNHLTFTSESSTYILALNEILYVSSNNKSSVIHTEAKDYETAKLLKEIEEKLSQKRFMRIHKGFIVNLDVVASLKYDKGGAYLLQLKNEDETSLPVGRAFASKLKEALGLK